MYFEFIDDAVTLHLRRTGKTQEELADERKREGGAGMGKTTGYAREDVMQALVAALAFGEDAGLAAPCAVGGAILPGAGMRVRMSEGAIDLLVDAMALATGVSGTDTGHGTTAYDLRDIA